MTASSVDIALFAAKFGLVFFVNLILATYLVFAERRILAWVQDRKGPNRVDPFGLLQPLADQIKLLTKEDFLPAAAGKWLFYLAPTAIMIFAVIPFGAPLLVAGLSVPLVVAVVSFSLKAHSLAFFFIWMLGTLPRLRYDLLMHLGRKVLTPLVLLNILVTA